MANEPKADNQVTVITATSSTDVAFTEKIGSVDQALKDRTTAKKDIKIKWALVVKEMLELDLELPQRRPNVEEVTRLVERVVVYKAPDAKLDDKEAVKLAREITDLFGEGSSFHRYGDARHALYTKFPDLKAWIKEQQALNELSYKSQEVDKAATKEKRAPLQKAIDAFVEAHEKFNETMETVSDVKEYIDVVKNVAEISAIKNGSYTSAK